MWRTRAPLAEDYSTRTTDLLSPEMLANKEVLKRLTIEQKIDFWRRVMQHAHDRNISFYVVTWNIFTYGVDGKYGITDAIDNPKTVDYFRASVREMFRTYPLLAGIGLTAGENMGEVKMYSGGVDSFDAKENWLFATYGQGVLDAARAEPERQFTLIHRQHESRAQDIAATFKPVIDQPNVDFVFSFKYAQAHALSSTTQTFHRSYVESLGPLKTLWTHAQRRRADVPLGGAGFRARVRAQHSARTFRGLLRGFGHVGVGPRIPAREPAQLPRQLEIDKHWLHFLLWGRLGYDPTLDNERIAALVGRRFSRRGWRAACWPAWQDASMVYPLVTGFHWADFDFQWYIEGCRSRPGPAKTASGFHSVETFINQPVHPGTDNIPIPKFVAGRNAAAPRRCRWRTRSMRAPTPHCTRAASLEDSRRTAQCGVRRHAGGHPRMALLGKYYAAKIRGATALALFRARGAPANSGKRSAARRVAAGCTGANTPAHGRALPQSASGPIAWVTWTGASWMPRSRGHRQLAPRP